MARDGSGTYNLPAVAIVPAHSLTNSSNFNATITDIAAALTQSISKDGQTVATGWLPMGGNKHTNVAPAGARSEYARADQVQDSAMQWGGGNLGTASALAISPSPPITGYVGGQRFSFFITTACTGTATLAVNSLAAQPIAYPRWGTNSIVEVVWAGGTFYQVSGDGSAIPDIPTGSVVIFRQATAPTGWTQQLDADDRLLRIRHNAGGFGTGGSWVIGGLSGESAGHTHAFSTTTSQGTSNTFNATTGGGGATGSASIHTHTLSGTTGGETVTHTHGGDGSWRPSFIDVIACSKN